MNQPRRLVWDLPLRMFHWLFAASILASWATAEAGFNWMKVHMRLGYFMIGLLCFRLIWGFIGPRHARFGNFLASPTRVWRYFQGLIGRSEAIHTVGHNPLGGLMVVLMLLLVMLQVTTGLFSTDDIAWTGPYYGAVSDSTAQKLTAIHHLNFNFILAAIVLHLCAIGYYALVKKQNLVPAMWTGHKHADAVPADEAITHSHLLKALAVIAVAALAVFLVLHFAPPAAAPSTD
ncbi:MAG TPA: cytochrome b/b6 domain-containing protein [Steroidobacteraceae bacterium]|nr:cytochrome b/b6 domain-containing protein [Steroidobacteraceae bacterium]